MRLCPRPKPLSTVRSHESETADCGVGMMNFARESIRISHDGVDFQRVQLVPVTLVLGEIFTSV